MEKGLNREMTTITDFIEKMQGVYGEPNEHQVRIVFEKLGDCSGPVLDMVVEHFFTTRRYKSWPMPAEIITAAADAKATLNPPPPWRPHVAPGFEEWTDEHINKANELIKSTVGVQALEGGWLEDLWQFCRKSCRLPDRHEQADIQRKSNHHATMDRAFAKVESDDGWRDKSYGIRASLVNLYRVMQERAGHHAEIVEKWERGEA